MIVRARVRAAPPYPPLPSPDHFDFRSLLGWQGLSCGVGRRGKRLHKRATVHAGQAGERVKQPLGSGGIDRDQNGLTIRLFQPPHPPPAQCQQPDLHQFRQADIAACRRAKVADLSFIDLDHARSIRSLGKSQPTQGQDGP